ncbi:fibrous sheath CABYR-binding protein [Eurosta solidaginis]|uniref:fibrous sheath CABYR-binding protein n=1 Tax=Eurosta solidaginis TaxID=178769 RepID=UPI003530C10D
MRVKIMWKRALLLMCFSGCCLAGPLHGIKRNVPAVMREQETAETEESPAPEPLAPEFPAMPSKLTLPSNATSIRTEITDNFSCDDKVYGYYADIENECQIFHVCLPVTYADGKENTFRWSFICPEETIFSQDSFTCMRREDMSIECADSVLYYELNRNFGMAEEQTINSNGAQSMAESAEEQPTPEESLQPDMQQPVMSEQQSEITAPPKPAIAQPKPMKYKPVKLPKPNRRKPQQKPKPQQDLLMSPANKQPAIMPLRKTNLGSKDTISKPVEEQTKPVIASESKPVPPRYKKRPAVIKNSAKEKAELPPFKVEMISKASLPDSFKRKRPTFSHKTSLADNNLIEKIPVVKTVPESVAVEPVESAPSKEETVWTSEPEVVAVEQAPTEPIQLIEDAEPQASETSVIFVEPENALTTAFETIATQLKDAEPVSVVVNKSAENLAAEESTKNEELLAQETTKTEEAAPVETIQAADEGVTPIEVNEKMPAVNSETSANAPDSEPLQNSSNLEGNAEKFEVLSLPAVLDDQLSGASEHAALGFAPNEITAEALPDLPTLEELEELKPSDAVESVPATPEMEEQNPIVQQAFAETDNHMQSVGGFKPVDPELAAEAEALLSDFVSALKSENPNTKPKLTLPIGEESSAASVEKEDAKVGVEDKTLGLIKADSNLLGPTTGAQPVPSKQDENKNASEKETAVAEESKLEDSPMLKFPISNSFPVGMYQIPVTVIQTPYEEESVMQVAQKIAEEKQKPEESQTVVDTQSEKEEQKDTKTIQQKLASLLAEVTGKDKVEDVPAAEELHETADLVASEPNAQSDPHILQSETPASNEIQREIEQPAAPVAYRPISIDDIVELVKERLDQTPADEKGTPMELVMEPGNTDKPVELKFSTTQKGTAAQEESAEQTPAENIIFPIYHRLSAPEVNAVDDPSAAVKRIAAKTDDEAVELSVDKTPTTATNTKSEAMSLPAKEAISSATAELADAPKEKNTAELDVIVKANRAFRSRSLANAKLDPRKRRFLFKADAS